MRKIINILSVLLQKYIYRSKVSSHSNKVSWGAKLYDCEIKNYNYFGPNTIINNAIISNYCSIAPNVIIGGMEHDYKKFSTSTSLFNKQKRQKTVIEDDVWIGANSVVKMGVTIGKGSIVGASTIVLKNVPPLSIIVGNPGKVIKQRFIDEDEIKKYNSIDFSLTPNKIHELLNDGFINNDN